MSLALGKPQQRDGWKIVWFDTDSGMHGKAQFSMPIDRAVRLFERTHPDVKTFMVHRVTADKGVARG